MSAARLERWVLSPGPCEREKDGDDNGSQSVGSFEWDFGAAGAEALDCGIGSGGTSTRGSPRLKSVVLVLEHRDLDLQPLDRLIGGTCASYPGIPAVTRERIVEFRPAQMLARLLQRLVRRGEIDEVGPVRLIGVAARVLAEGDVMRDS